MLLPPAGAAERHQERAAGAEDCAEESPERKRGAAGGETGEEATPAGLQSLGI